MSTYVKQKIQSAQKYICECGERVAMTRAMLRGNAVELHSIRSGFASDLQSVVLANKDAGNTATLNKVDVLDSIRM
jgi:hypothetical protein